MTSAQKSSTPRAESSVVQRRRQPTLYDVAEVAGVSHQTVSRYLKGGSALRPATEERVTKALSELHYTPNLAARALRSRQPYKIIIVLPEATIHTPPMLVSGATATAHTNGYRVDVVTIEGDEATRAARLRRFVSGDDIAGVLTFTPLPAQGLRGLPGHPPLVVAGEYDDALRAPGCLADGSPTAAVVRHLASLGHRDFFHVAGPTDWSSARSRAAVYEETILELGLTSHGIATGDWSLASGHAVGTRIADLEYVTAVVAASDQMAIGVIRALHENGLKVPDDISVTGWDDMAESAFLVPSLSTVRMDAEALGARSVMDLIRRTREAPAAALPPLARAEIVLRESVGPARRRAPGTA